MPSIWPQRRNPLEDRVLRRRRTPASALPGLGECSLLINDNDQSKLLTDDVSSSNILRLDGGAFAAIPPPPVPQDADQYILGQQGSFGGSNFRYDIRWRPDGTRVFLRQNVGNSHPSLDNLFQYDVPIPWDINAATWVFAGSIQIGGDTNGRTIEWVLNGTRLVFLDVWFSSFRRLNSFAASTPYDITTLGANTSTYTNLVGTGQFGMKWNEDWTKVILTRSGGAEWQRYDVATPGLVATITGVDQTWLAAQGDTMAFAPGALKMYTLRSNAIKSMDLGSAFSIDPAPTNIVTGFSLLDPIQMSVPRGMNIRPDTLELFGHADQSAGSFRLRSWVTP